MTYQQDTKYFDKIAKQKVMCKHCGHIILFLSRVPKLVCNHCGHNVYRNEKEEFKDKMKKKIRERRKDSEKN